MDALVRDWEKHMAAAEAATDFWMREMHLCAAMRIEEDIEGIKNG
jgi:hypothetical protein